jgi:hypothetical protein
MPRRDYLLSLIEQAIQVLLSITFQRESGKQDDAVNTVVDSIEKLFGITVQDLAMLSADQLYDQLTREESPENARNKCIIFAALNYQAGLAYEAKGLKLLSQEALHVALIFTLRALVNFPKTDLPDFTPDAGDILRRLEGFSLPPTTTHLLSEYRSLPEEGLEPRSC